MTNRLTAETLAENGVRQTALYQITGALAGISMELEQALNDPDLSDVERTAKIDQLMNDFDAVSEALPEKIENCVKYLHGLESQCDSLRREESLLAGRRKIIERNGEVLKDYIARCLRNCADHKVKTLLGTASMSIQKEAKVVVTDESELPAENKYWRRKKPEPDLRAILTAYKEGEIEAKGFHVVDVERVRIP